MTMVRRRVMLGPHSARDAATDRHVYRLHDCRSIVKPATAVALSGSRRHDVARTTINPFSRLPSLSHRLMIDATRLDVDLLLAVPRMAQRAGVFALYDMPEAVDNFAGKIWNGGSIIADATGQQTMNSTITNTSNLLARSTAAVLHGIATKGLNESSSTGTSSIFGTMLTGVLKLKSLGGIFSYLLSRWALMTFIVVRAYTMHPGQTISPADVGS
nr:hypothetical protein CFP56_77636 [Quercus suber]